MDLYQVISTIPFSQLNSKDLKYINMASIQAEKSSFDSSLRLGACIRLKGQCLLWREYT